MPAALAGYLRRDPLATFLLVASALILIVFFVLLGSLGPAAAGREVPLSTLDRLAADKQIATAELLDYDNQVVFAKKSGEQLYADYPGDAATDVLAALGRSGATIAVDPQSGKSARVAVVQFLLPILLLVCLFAFFIRTTQRSGSDIGAFSAFRGRRRRKTADGPTFASVAGAGEAVTELAEVVDFLDAPERYRAIGATAPRGVLLVGPPGTGKTLLARATAGEAEAAFFSASGSEFVESLVGVGAARIRDLFAKARRAAPAIVFIDELDAAGRKRGAGVGQGNDEREQTLNQLLVEMDGFGGDGGVVVIAATNRPDVLDPALLRPGRFDRQVVVDVPDVRGRTEILELHARGRRLDPDVDLAELATLCPGFTGADLANLVNEAALLSVRDGRSAVSQADLEEAIERVVAGPQRQTHLLSEEERRTIAIHEAGHATVTHGVVGLAPLRKVSILARGRRLGTAAEVLGDRDVVIQRRLEFEGRLLSILAGTAAERIEFGDTSTAAADDLHAATRLAREMVTRWGMSEQLGPMTIGDAGGEVFLGASLQDLGSIGQRTLDLVDGETERLLTDAQARAEAVLRANWAATMAVADALRRDETLGAEELDELLAEVRPVELSEIPVASAG